MLTQIKLRLDLIMLAYRAGLIPRWDALLNIEALKEVLTEVNNGR